MLPTEEVRTYAQEKMRLLQLAEIPLKTALALLTAGMPVPYRTTLYTANPETFDEWLRIALTIENTGKELRFRSREHRETINIAHLSDWVGERRMNGNEGSQRPTNPCKFCKRRGISAYHWH